MMPNKGIYLSRENRYSIFLIIHFVVYPQPCLCSSCMPVEYILTLSKQIKQLTIQVDFHKTQPQNFTPLSPKSWPFQFSFRLENFNNFSKNLHEFLRAIWEKMWQTNVWEQSKFKGTAPNYVNIFTAKICLIKSRYITY
jgi:hypothetical protein